jgi:GT2 family glycosyltransferase
MKTQMAATAPSSQIATPSVCCVLLNWNGWQDTVACLDSLATQVYPSLRILVVDNGSTNDSVTRIRIAHPNITLIESGENLGFARGCNIGLRNAATQGDDFVWLLNNDTVAPPDTCSKLVARALAEPRAGLIGSVLYFMDDPSQVQAWGGGNVNPWLGQSTHFVKPTPLGPHSYLTFASALIPREVLFRVGVIFEGSFMYWEDSDYSLRVTAAGYTLAIAEDTAILHKEGGSIGPRSPTIDRYSAAAGLHFLRRNSPMPPVSMTIFIAVRLLSRVARGAWKNAQAVLSGCRDYLAQRKIAYTDQL